MLSERLRILDTDSSVVRQLGFFAQHHYDIVDLTDLSCAARLWTGRPTMEEIERRLAGTDPHALTFFGSGDYHHLSYILLKRQTSPFSIISFDFHPDWDARRPRLGCGSWLRAALSLPNVANVTIIGAGSRDLATGHMQWGCLKDLKAGRLRVLAHGRTESRAIMPGWQLKTIAWEDHRRRSPRERIREIVERAPGRRVYVTVDKDCLSKEYAATNWEEGGMDADQLVSYLQAIRDTADILGADVTGDYSEVRRCPFIRNFLAALDHPGNDTARNRTENEITDINGRMNLKIADCLVP